MAVCVGDAMRYKLVETHRPYSGFIFRVREYCVILYCLQLKMRALRFIKISVNTRVGALIVATIYLQLIQNRYMFRSFTVLQCSHQHCVQPVASYVEVVGYL